MSYFQSNHEVLLPHKVIHGQQLRTGKADGFIRVNRNGKWKKKQPYQGHSSQTRGPKVGDCTSKPVEEKLATSNINGAVKRSYAAAMINGPSLEQHIESAKRAFKTKPAESSASDSVPWVIKKFNWADECDSDNED
jgi:hypothetical protein